MPPSATTSFGCCAGACCSGWPWRSARCSACACSSADRKRSARSPRTRSARCVSSRSGWWPRRKRSGRTCRGSCTTTSAQVLTALRMELGTNRADQGERRRPHGRGGRRGQEARGQHVPHGPRSRARPEAQHARRFRPAGGARMARARLHRPVRRGRGPAHGGQLRRRAGAAPDVRVSGRPGSADQLRPPRAGRPGSRWP